MWSLPPTLPPYLSVCLSVCPSYASNYPQHTRRSDGCTAVSTGPDLSIVCPCVSVAWWVIASWRRGLVKGVCPWERLKNGKWSLFTIHMCSLPLYVHYLLQYPLTSTPALRHPHVCTHYLICGPSQVIVSLPTGHAIYRSTLYGSAHYVWAFLCISKGTNAELCDDLNKTWLAKYPQEAQGY